MKEAEFSRSLIQYLKGFGYNTTRIESHGTGNGIPDMFVQGHGTDFWLELKADNKLSVNDKVITVQWRPGQIAWMYNYYIFHRGNKCCLTIIKVSNGMFIIPMTKNFEGHRIYNPIGWSKKDPYNLPRIINAMVDCNYQAHNYLDAINTLCQRHYPGVDYDPECLWNLDLLEKSYDHNVFNQSKLNIILTMEATALNM